MTDSKRFFRRREESRGEPSFRAEKYCWHLYKAAVGSVDDNELDVILSMLTRYISWILRYPDGLSGEFDYARGATGALLVLHRALRHRKTRDRMWEWVRGLMRDACDNETYQRALGIGVFELIAQYPLELEDPEEAELVYRLFSCYDDPATRWVIFDAYTYCAEKLPGDLRRVIDWCRRHSLPSPGFDTAEVLRWVEENRLNGEEEDDEPEV